MGRKNQVEGDLEIAQLCLTGPSVGRHLGRVTQVRRDHH